MNESPLLRFVQRLSRLCAQPTDEAALLGQVTAELAELVARDDWLPEAFSVPDPDRYQQYLLYGDPLDRFSVVSFVWGPGQKTPIHDHTVWGAIGMLRGAERSQAYRRTADGMLPAGPARLLEPGDVETVWPLTGDIHEVANAFADRNSISIHVYGGNIGRIVRHVFDAASGAQKPFVSDYSGAAVPNLWSMTAGPAR